MQRRQVRACFGISGNSFILPPIFSARRIGGTARSRIHPTGLPGRWRHFSGSMNIWKSMGMKKPGKWEGRGASWQRRMKGQGQRKAVQRKAVQRRQKA